ARRAPGGFLPRLLRSKKERRVHRHAVDVDLEVDVGTRRQTGGAYEPDDLSRGHPVPGAHRERGQVAVEDAHVGVDEDLDVIARAGRVVSGQGQTGRRRADLRAEGHGEVDAGVDVVRRT